MDNVMWHDTILDIHISVGHNNSLDPRHIPIMRINARHVDCQLNIPNLKFKINVSHLKCLSRKMMWVNMI